MRELIAAVFLALPASRAEATGKNGDVGTSAAEFLMLGPDARGVAMGQAMGALAHDASSIYWNPAGLAGLEYRNAIAAHTIYFQSTFYDYLAYAQPVPSILGSEDRASRRPNQLGAVGVSVMYLSAGNMSEIDNAGTPTGANFTPRDYAATVAWGAPLTDMLDVGAGFKYVNSQIEESASAGALDLGVLAHFRIGTLPAAVSLSAHNLGGSLKFLSQADPLPLHAKLGTMLRPLKHWVITSDLIWPRDKGPYPAVGTEWRIPFAKTDAVSLRAGYNARTQSTDLEKLSGFSAGAGLSIAWLRIDYAWVPFGVLEDSHHFSFSFRF